MPARRCFGPTGVRLRRVSEFKTNQRLKFRVSDRDGSHERSVTGTVEGWTVGTRPGVGATDVARVRGIENHLETSPPRGPVRLRP